MFLQAKSSDVDPQQRLRALLQQEPATWNLRFLPYQKRQECDALLAAYQERDYLLLLIFDGEAIEMLCMHSKQLLDRHKLPDGVAPKLMTSANERVVQN